MKEFYVCHNPFMQFAEGVVHYLCNASKPRFFALVRKVDLSRPFSIGCSGHNIGFVYQGPDGTISFMIMIINQYIDKLKNDNFLPLLRDAVVFYTRYLGHEDNKKLSGKTGYKLFEDYNPLTPGMQIFHLQSQNTYILSHPLILKTFESIEGALEYLEEQFAYKDEQLVEGRVNVIAL
jgi:hypothetical protein